MSYALGKVSDHQANWRICPRKQGGDFSYTSTAMGVKATRRVTEIKYINNKTALSFLK
jgi:hypothetical protein